MILFQKFPFLFVSLILLLINSGTKAQNKLIDSLKNEWNKHPQNDTLHYEWEFQNALYYYGRAEKDKAITHLNEAYKLAKKMQYADGFADYYHYKAVASNKDQMRDTAMQYAKQELQWALRAVHPQKLATAYNDLGNLHISFGNGDSATVFLLKGLPVAEQNNLQRLAANIAYNLSAAYDMIENHELSRSYALKSFQIAKQLNDTAFMFKSLYNLATQENQLKQNDTAKKLFQQCIVFAKVMDCDGCLADVYNNMGEIFYGEKKFPEALEQYNKMAVITKKIDDPQYDLYLMMNRGNTLTALGRYDEAEKDLNNAVAIARSEKANYELSQILTFSSVLSEKMNNYKSALTLWKQADSLKEMIAGEKSLKDIHRLEVQYQAAEKDKSLAEQQALLATKQAAIHKKDLMNTGLIIVCALLLAISFLVYRNLRHRHKLSLKEKELHEQRIRELEKEQQLVAAQSLMKGQEEERSRLAKDLHDGVGGLLSGVKLSLSTMKGNVFLTEENAMAVNTIIGQLDSSINELRRVSHNMMPEALIKFGLKEALENYCENLNQSGQIDVRLQTYGLEQRMEQDSEIILYRIVQELLNNVIKHADAKQVLVQLIREDNKFTLTVEDDGKGFDAHSPEYKAGAGLRNIQARAGYLNGIVDIRTRPGEGTSVTIEGTVN